MLKPDSTRSSSAFQTRISGPEWIEPDSAEALSESRLGAFRGREDLPSDLALDLRLREILQQARLTTAANGAVIALALGERMVCRATLGDKSPSVGVSMNTRSGLAGACVQSREMQLCDDSLADPRVNAMACRDLDIRSIVVLPVLGGGELWGILEVFSSSPRAFSDSDLQSLQSLSRKISRTVQEAIQSGSRAVASGAFARPDPEPTVSETLPYPNPAERYSQDAVPRDYRTGVLTVAVLALAVFLGWMVGRVGWSMAVNRAPIQLPLASQERTAARTCNSRCPTCSTKDRTKYRILNRSYPDQTSRFQPSPPLRQSPKQPSPPDRREVWWYTNMARLSSGCLQTKAMLLSKIRRMLSSQERFKRRLHEKKMGRVSPSPVTPPAGNNYLLERVEPQYPEAAKQQHIQGPVILGVLVGIDGSVKDLSVISGIHYWPALQPMQCGNGVSNLTN